MAFALTQNVLFLAGSMLADSLRFGGWYLFLILLMRPESADGVPASVRFGWLSGIALLLVVFAFGAQLLVVTGIDLALPAQRLSLFSSLAMSVFGLVLLEHLFRNVSPDFRWSIKPLCLGLGRRTKQRCQRPHRHLAAPDDGFRNGENHAPQPGSRDHGGNTG